MARKEYAVAVRAAELGTGVQIRHHGSAGEIHRAVTEVLKHAVYRESAYKIGADFRECRRCRKNCRFYRKNRQSCKSNHWLTRK